jgi:hypothetical protein
VAALLCANGHSNDLSARFCSTCGVGIAADASPPPPPTSQPLPQAPPLTYVQTAPPTAPPPPPGYQAPAAGYPVPGYPPAGYAVGAYVDMRPTNGLAIASMVLGIVWLWWVGSILALVFGIIAHRQITKNNQKGMGMAIAGIVLGCVGVATLIAVIVFAVAAHHTSTGYNANLDLLAR